MNEYIEGKIREHERDVYGGEMPVINKATMRKQLEEEERYVANEEREHSHSPVGDWNGMRE